MNYFSIYVFSILVFTLYGENVSNHPSWAYIPEDCGRSRFDTTTTRIIKGDKVRLGEFPWMGRLGKIKKDGKPFFFCGASLINRYYALSAAHCEQRPDILRLGENYANTSIDCDESGDCAPIYQDIKIKVVLTENYCRNIRVNDLTVLELSEPAKFNEYVQPICLPRGHLAEENLTNGDTVILAGWGVTNGFGVPKLSDNLMRVDLPVLDFESCKIIHHKTVETGQFCLKATEKGQNACKGDSGGPAFKFLVVDGKRKAYIFGVCSYGLLHCKHSVIYTKVSDFLGSILDKIEKS